MGGTVGADMGFTGLGFGSGGGGMCSPGALLPAQTAVHCPLQWALSAESIVCDS